MERIKNQFQPERFNVSKEIVMTRFLGVLVLIVAGVLCLGLYLGWFHFDSETTGGQSHITLTVDKDKIKADENKVIDKVRDTVKRSEPAPTVPK
jgi:hypothetical protein